MSCLIVMRNATASTTFRKVLPLLQILSTILLFALYLKNWRVVTPIRVRTPAGESTVLIHDYIDATSRQVDWVQAINFPASWIVVPAELAATKGEGLDVGYEFYGPMRFLTFGLVGAFIWLLAGRSVDRVIAFVRQKEAILPLPVDWMFCLCVALSGFLEIALESANRVYLGWGLLWVVLGCGAGCTNIFQARSLRNARLRPNSAG